MSPRRIALAVDAVSALILVSVAVALAGLTWRLAGDRGRAPGNALPVAPPPPPVDIAPILALAPFGKPASAASPTSLGLELRGILLAEPRSASTVLIASGGGPAQSYAPGQAIAGGATIDTIAVDHVLLRVGGRTELLGFPNRNGGTPGALGGNAPATYAAPPQPAPAAQPPQPAVAAPPPAGRAFLDSLGVVVTDGGYRIGANPSAATRLAGLLPGDVIEKVNGKAVGDVDQDSRTLDTAFRSGGARVEVLRGGRRITMLFPSR